MIAIENGAAVFVVLPHISSGDRREIFTELCGDEFRAEIGTSWWQSRWQCDETGRNATETVKNFNGIENTIGGLNNR